MHQPIEETIEETTLPPALPLPPELGREPPPPELALGMPLPDPPPTAAATEQPRHPGGRPRVLDEHKRNTICTVVTFGCPLEDAADYIGCAPRTIYNEMERDPEFAARVKKARVEQRMVPLSQLRFKCGTSWRAIAWYLERTNPDLLGRRPANMVPAEKVQAFIEGWTKIWCDQIEDSPRREELERKTEELIQGLRTQKQYL